jgi:peptide chain release factor 3
MRKTPVMIFINKMDREGKDPFDLLDELESELDIHVRPLSWPINQGFSFKGVYNIYEENLQLYTPNKQTISESVEISDINSEELEKFIGEKDARQLRQDLELIQGIYPAFDREKYLSGELAPVFFWQRLEQFRSEGIAELLVEIAPSPQPVHAQERVVNPYEETFTGFVFKIHANMDPNHRSCIAFVKICSGKFERNVNYKHIRQGKMMRFSSPTAFMAQKKEIVDEAYAGDIVGLPDNGNLKLAIP